MAQLYHFLQAPTTRRKFGISFEFLECQDMSEHYRVAQRSLTNCNCIGVSDRWEAMLLCPAFVITQWPNVTWNLLMVAHDIADLTPLSCLVSAPDIYHLSDYSLPAYWAPVSRRPNFAFGNSIVLCLYHLYTHTKSLHFFRDQMFSTKQPRVQTVLEKP